MAEAAVIAGGVAVAGIVGSVLQRDAAREAASGAQRAAEAQLAEERATRAAALEFADFTPEELAQIESTIALNEQDIERKQELLDSADPALIEAGRQALQLLRGEEAKTLDPIRRQRQEDRLKLEDNLRSQLGTGFATSSAGIQALNDFDSETGSFLAVEQDRSLGRLLGTAQNVEGLASITGNIATGGNLANLLGAGRRRGIAAITQTPITQAGAPFVGDVLGAQAQGRFAAGVAGSIGTGLSLAAILGSGGPTGNKAQQDRITSRARSFQAIQGVAQSGVPFGRSSQIP